MLTTIILNLVISSISIEEPCQSINIGIKSEKVLTYTITGEDTILNYTTEVYFDKLGRTIKAISFLETVSDTNFTIVEYDEHKIIQRKEYWSNDPDTMIFTAVEWNENGRGTKFIEEGREGSYSEFQYENCTAIHKKAYAENELVYSIDYHWDDFLLKQMTIHFYGSFKESVGKSVAITQSTFGEFDDKGNWTERNFIKEEQKFIDYRYLEYY